MSLKLGANPKQKSPSKRTTCLLAGRATHWLLISRYHITPWRDNTTFLTASAPPFPCFFWLLNKRQIIVFRFGPAKNIH